jgi:hypothetical protein
MITGNSRKGWRVYTREKFPVRALFPTVKIFHQRIFDAAAAFLMNCSRIADSVRSENAP